MGQGTWLWEDWTQWLYLHLHLTSQRNIPKPVDTSSQVSTLDDVKMAEASLEGVPITISPIACNY